MKWYSVKPVNDNASKVIIYKENLSSNEVPTYENIISHSFIESNSYVEGYCACLENFGYKKWNGWGE